MDINKLKNGKYFAGKMSDFKKTRGWFVGSFFKEGHLCKTNNVEIQYTFHERGHICKKHYHQKKIELNIILKGKVNYSVNGKPNLLNAGDFIFIDVNNVVMGEFLEDCEILSIHSPSIPNDKVIVKE